ncbi:MAG: hypothetical protein LBF24_00630 [Puniceicoccales bacterium]|jgi:DNA polymerase-3 subunit delta'|nr:hypothetical protein [Puniceicoccales bacterium]
MEGIDRQFLERFAVARAAGRLPHAILLVGPDLNVLEKTISAAARSLLPTHSLDLLALQPAGKSRQIGAEIVRELMERLHLSSRGAIPPVALIHGADRLHRSAANALLKTLEEPPPGVLLLLSAQRIGDVLPTIRSRCQIYRCSCPSSADRPPGWDSWLENYGTYVRKCLENSDPIQLLDGYGLVAGFCALLDNATTDIKRPVSTKEPVTKQIGARRVVAESLLADCGERLLAIAKELPTAENGFRRLALLRLSRQMAALGRTLWLLEKNCPEIAAVESFVLAGWNIFA